MRPILQERDQLGEFNLVKSMFIVDESSFTNYFRMSRSSYHALLQDIQPFLQKMNTNWRPSISPAERFSMTLRYGSLLTTRDGSTGTDILYVD